MDDALFFVFDVCRESGSCNVGKESCFKFSQDVVVVPVALECKNLSIGVCFRCLIGFSELISLQFMGLVYLFSHISIA